MEATNRATRRHPPDPAKIPIPGVQNEGVKYLITAVLAAGQDGCECPACKLLKKFGANLSQEMLKEGAGG
jgi:hypothetical protein